MIKRYIQQVYRLAILFFGLTSAFFSSCIYASNLYIGTDSYEYVTDVDKIKLDYRLTGGAVGGELDVGESTFLQFGVGEWSDDIGLIDSGDAEIRSSLKSVGAGYSFGNWEVFASYRKIEDEIEIIHGKKREFFTSAETKSTVASVDVSYQWEVGLWAHTVLLGVQSDKRDVDAALDDPKMHLSESSNFRYVNIKWNSDYYFYLSDISGVFAGVSLDWYDQISGSSDDENVGAPPPPPPTNGGGGNGGGGNGTSATGESGGGVGLYVIYDMDTHWSVDINMTQGAFGDADLRAYSLTLTYNL